jgi:hypothetical protein
MKKITEKGYVKSPRKPPIDVSFISEEESVVVDKENIFDLLKNEGRKSYTFIHTHPVEEGEIGSKPLAYPCNMDLFNFLKDGRQKTMIIAQQNSERGNIEGYLILRKTQRTPTTNSRLIFDLNDYEEERWGPEGNAKALEKLRKSYNLQVRTMPTKGYGFKGGFGFTKKISGLDEKIKLVSAIIGFILVATLSLNNFTGLVISSEITKYEVNLLSIILLGIIISWGFYLRYKAKKQGDILSKIKPYSIFL